MLLLSPALQPYAWGSPTAIPELLGLPADGSPVAEAWFGAHPVAPAQVPTLGRDLGAIIAEDPLHALGDDVVERFGVGLPFLLKVVAPVRPLSLQVHPSAEQAALGFVREERSGKPLDAPDRTYRDSNHKPEMLLALTTFEALSGFRTARRALQVLAGLDVPLVAKAVERVRHGSSAEGMRSAFEYLLLGARDRDHDVDAVVDLVRARLAAGDSPSEHSDRVLITLAEAFPGDRGVVASLLLNPVTLQPGEVMFVPAGCVHAYVRGVGVEVMASSDNVVRAGLTPKHVDARALMGIVDVRPAPPMRVAPEQVADGVAMYYAPVEDFELAVIEVDGTEVDGAGVSIGRPGPRILLVLDGELDVVTPAESARLRRGQAVFVAADEQAVISGHGRAVRVSVP
ncbi:mannose-6-phosphate isomerase, class I [Salana multivorans]